MRQQLWRSDWKNHIAPSTGFSCTACIWRHFRLRRRRFYEAAGLKDLGVSALVFGVKMDLLGIRCRMTFEDYKNFYRDFYNPWAAEHLEEF